MITTTDQITTFFKYRVSNEGVCLLLNGKWGSGKTYFWENSLKPQLKKDFSETPVLYVSCFGIEDPEQFKKIFYNALISRFSDDGKNKILEETVSTIAIGVKGFLQKQLEEKTGVVLDLKIDPFTLLPRDLILCIDDVERKNTSLPIDFILGFSSRLMKEKNAKILLIADETELLKESDSNKTDSTIYKAFKEKVIRRTISWTPLVEDIIEISFDKEETFLKSAKIETLQAFKASNSTNFRSVFQIFDHLKYIKKAHPTTNFNDSFFYTLAVFTIEGAKGTLEDFDFYKNCKSMHIRIKMDNNKDLTPIEKKQKIFLSTYAKDGNNFYAYKSAYDLVLNSLIDEDLLMEEFPDAIIDNSESTKLLSLLKSEKSYFGKKDDVDRLFILAEKLILEPDTMNAARYVEIFTSYAVLSLRFLNDISTTKEVFIKNLKIKADSGDMSIHPLHSMHYSSFDWLVPIINDYVLTLKKIIEAKKLVELTKQIEQCSDGYPEFINNSEDCNLVLVNAAVVFKNLPIEDLPLFYRIFGVSFECCHSKETKKLAVAYLEKIIDNGANVDPYLLVGLKEISNYLKIKVN